MQEHSIYPTLGADPEMFVRRQTKNKGPGTDTAPGPIIPVCGLVGGTKDKPIQFPDTRTTGFAYQEDNVSFEVNIPPCESARTFDASINLVLQLSRALLGKKGLVYDLRRSAHRFHAVELRSNQAQVIGCDPDMCAYGGSNDKPIAREPFDIKDLGTWRFTGGHVHFGWDTEKIDIPVHVMVRLVDATVYLPIIAKDKQKARRSKYGLAGLYRPKPYGMEYRSMSNFWLSDPTCVSVRAFNLLSDVYHNIDLLCDFYQDLPIEDVRACIDSGGTGADVVLAKIRKCSGFRKLNIEENISRSTPKTFAAMLDVAVGVEN